MTRHLLAFAAGVGVGLAVRAARLHRIDQCGCLVGTEQRSNGRHQLDSADKGGTLADRLHETRDRLDQINGDLAQVNDVLTAHVAAGDARIAALRAELSAPFGGAR